MRGTNKSKSGLFLIELIVAILFFAVTSAICVQVFAKAHLISRESQDTTAAINLAQNYAEEWKAMPSEDKWVAPNTSILRYTLTAEGNLERSDDDSEEATYLVRANHECDENGMANLRVGVYRMDDPMLMPLIEFTAKDYIGPREVVPVG